MRFVHRRNNSVSATMDTEVEWAGRTTSGYKPRQKHIDITGGRTDLPEKDLRGGYADYIYPNLVPLPKPTFIWMVRIDPITPERTRMFSRVYGLTHDVDEQNDAIRLLELANQEDTDMITILMENVRSPFYRAGPAATWEGRIAQILRLLRSDVETPLAPDEFEGSID